MTNAVEAGYPNHGYGNNDGTPDGQQDNATSLPNAVDGQYATLVSRDGTELKHISAIADLPEDPPAGVGFPVGLLEFTVSGIAPGGQR